MALPLAKAAPLKPQIKLAQALSEFEAVLPDDQKIKLRTYRGQSPPTPTDVTRFTAEVDRDAGRNRKSRQCVGTRLTNVLHSVQQFSTIADVIVGSSQSQIAGAVWGTVKISLQEFGLLYPESTRLQNALCDYFVVIVCLCKQAVIFLKKPFLSQLSSSLLRPFESEFGVFHQDLESLASGIREEVSLASNQAQQDEATQMSKFRAFTLKKLSDTSTRDLGETRTWKRKKAELLFLNACSVYDYEKSWKQARKRGNTHWICHDEGYKLWKQEKVSSTLWCTGILGSGKTVLSANVVEDLTITTTAVVAYFFCRHDEVESLQARTIIGSVARQIFDSIKPDLVDEIAQMRSGIIDTDQILGYIQKLLPSDLHEYSIVIDGLDECEEKESRLLLQCLKQLLMSKTALRVYCSSRPDVFRWAPALLEPQWNVFMPQTSPDIEEYIENTLEQRLGSGNLSVGDPTIILTIRDVLLENARGMFLWVAFQIDSICSQKTDAAILTALKDLPKSLPDTFNRILRKLQHSDTADPHFCKNTFDLVAAAQRPLTLEELREAISIEPGETAWDASKLVNDAFKSLLDSCGSLIDVDEEHLTIHFAHHSVKQYLLSEPRDSELTGYHINMKDAKLYLSDVIVTYLNFGIFDQQLTKANMPMLPQVVNYPSAILGSLPGPSFANKWAMRLLKSRGDSTLDIHKLLKTAAGVVPGFKERTQSAHPFLSYAQEYWLIHTKSFHCRTHPTYLLWQRLINEEVKMIKLPWAPKKWIEFGDEYMEWIIQNKHWALIGKSLVDLSKGQGHAVPARILLQFLENNATDTNFSNIDLEDAVYLASFLNNKTTVVLLLKKGANINAPRGHYGNALQAASRAGHLEIVRLLLESGANVNAAGGYYGTSLQAASRAGHLEIVSLLLEQGAKANAAGGYYGTALQAASRAGHLEIVSLLLEHGAKANAAGGYYGTALPAASENGHKEIASLLLENGAYVNSQIEPSKNDMEASMAVDALQAASRAGHLEIVRLLLEHGASTEGGTYSTALQAASSTGCKEIARLLLDYGADVNAQAGQYRNSLELVARNGDKAFVQLLLDKGAIVDDKTMEAASSSGNGEVKKLIRNALKSQSSLVRDPASSSGGEPSRDSR
ncbi:hypothetical protein MMC22_009460 [Lobaria immixta]|nr:hypothetical protein [Lobaria immixta]